MPPDWVSADNPTRVAVVRWVMDSSTDVFTTLQAAIDARLQDRPAPDGTDERAELRARLGRLHLEADRVQAALHSHVTSQPVTYGEASFCAECGEPAPCPTIRELVAEYDAGG